MATKGDDLDQLLKNNEAWAAKIVARDPDFFTRLNTQQQPEYLWIGCSDSRVPANEIVAMQPGELFVHRNVANVVVHSDLNCLSVIQFAVDLLKVKHIMVVGHYGCSGVKAALETARVGIADHWLEHIRDVASRHQGLLDRETNPRRRESLLCELNVMEQALNVCSCSIVTDAWDRGQQLSIHGWIYSLKDGRLRHLDFSASSRENIASLRERAIHQLMSARKLGTA